jgi:hypothetical protein
VDVAHPQASVPHWDAKLDCDVVHTPDVTTATSAPVSASKYHCSAVEVPRVTMRYGPHASCCKGGLDAGATPQSCATVVNPASSETTAHVEASPVGPVESSFEALEQAARRRSKSPGAQFEEVRMNRAEPSTDPRQMERHAGAS